MRRAAALLLGVVALPALAQTHDVLEVDSLKRLHDIVAAQRRVVMFMHGSRCNATKAFKPWLYAISHMLPRLKFARADVSGAGKAIARAFKVPSNVKDDAAPLIKLVMREKPPGERVLNYRGPLEFTPLLSWCNATLIDGGRSHPYTEQGEEPDGLPDASAPRRGGVSGGDHLPPSVRAMAETMVREQRLQKALKARGKKMVDHYEALVSKRYKEIVAASGIATSNQHAVQEANRKARDQVREQILAAAPEDVREEIEAEVHLGGGKQQPGGQPAEGSKQAKRKPKAERKGAAESKDEL